MCAISLLLAAIQYSIKTHWVQFRQIKAILLQPFHAAKQSGSGISAFEAAATSLAATIGTGNIAGIAGAILLGGPGAVFWVWVSGILGMGLKYAEVLIAMRYRVRGMDGQWRGGPMYWVRMALPMQYQPLGLLFAIFGMFAALGMGDLVQISTVAESAESFVSAVSEGRFVNAITIRALTGILTASMLFIILSGGAKRIGRVSSMLVPMMSILYLLLCTIVILRHRASFFPSLASILNGAFNVKALSGAAAGIGLKEAFRVGLSRGVFSHEAGLGTASIAHSCAENTSAKAQARLGAFEVFFDVLICTVTAIVILTSRVPLPYGDATINSTLVIDALATCFGKPTSSAVITFSMLLFAFSSMTGFALYGARCAEFLFGTRGISLFYTVFLLIACIGPILPRSSVWELSELLNAILCVPNLIAMALILHKDHQLQKTLKT